MLFICIAETKILVAGTIDQKQHVYSINLYFVVLLRRLNVMTFSQ